MLKVATVDFHLDQLDVIATLVRVLNRQGVSCRVAFLHAAGILLLS